MLHKTEESLTCQCTVPFDYQHSPREQVAATAKWLGWSGAAAQGAQRVAAWPDPAKFLSPASIPVHIKQVTGLEIPLQLSRPGNWPGSPS